MYCYSKFVVLYWEIRTNLAFLRHVTTSGGNEDDTEGWLMLELSHWKGGCASGMVVTDEYAGVVVFSGFQASQLYSS